MSNNIFPINYRPLSVKTFLYDYLADKIVKSRPHEKTEIEMRKGFFKSKSSQPVISSLVAKLSTQNPVLINTDIKADIPFLRTALAQMEPMNYNFDPNIPEKEFFELIDLFDRFQPKDSRQSEFSVDFKLNSTNSFRKRVERSEQQNGAYATNGTSKFSAERLTWNVTEGTFQDSSKLHKENIDLLHQSSEYRISTCFEHNEDLAISDFLERVNGAGVSFMRVKSRINYTFQFMQFSFTISWNVNSEALSTLVLDRIKAAHNASETINSDTWIQVLMGIINQGRIKPSFEVESEIKDVDYLKGFIISQNFIQFHACIDRFLRNFELLYRTSIVPKHQEHQQFLRQHMKDDEMQFPVFGSYLETLISKDKQSK